MHLPYAEATANSYSFYAEATANNLRHASSKSCQNQAFIAEFKTSCRQPFDLHIHQLVNVQVSRCSAQCFSRRCRHQKTHPLSCLCKTYSHFFKTLPLHYHDRAPLITWAGKGDCGQLLRAHAADARVLCNITLESCVWSKGQMLRVLRVELVASFVWQCRCAEGPAAVKATAGDQSAQGAHRLPGRAFKPRHMGSAFQVGQSNYSINSAALLSCLTNSHMYRPLCRAIPDHIHLSCRTFLSTRSLLSSHDSHIECSGHGK